MANLRAIRTRIKSVENTHQITKSMKMVAGAKLRRTQTAFASLRDVNYITSARLMGARNSRILLVHLLPNTGRVLLPALTIGFNNAVLAEASMSFLRITPLETSLGSMLSEAQGMLAAAPWYALSTGLVIALLVFGVGLIGEGLQQRNKEA